MVHSGFVTLYWAGQEDILIFSYLPHARNLATNYFKECYVLVLIYLNILSVTFVSTAELSSKEGQPIYCRRKASLLQPAVRVPPTVTQAAID